MLGEDIKTILGIGKKEMKNKLTFDEVKRVRCLAKEGYSTTFLTRLVISSREVDLYKDLRAQVDVVIEEEDEL